VVMPPEVMTSKGRSRRTRSTHGICRQCVGPRLPVGRRVGARTTHPDATGRRIRMCEFLDASLRCCQTLPDERDVVGGRKMRLCKTLLGARTRLRKTLLGVPNAECVEA